VSRLSLRVALLRRFAERVFDLVFDVDLRESRKDRRVPATAR
jgi:hypothetical protein